MSILLAQRAKARSLRELSKEEKRLRAELANLMIEKNAVQREVV